MQMAGVKIADRVEDLKKGKEFKMDQYFTKKYELVQAVHQERREGMEPVIVRQRTEKTVEEEEVEDSGFSELRI
jgi:hypothetical protein